MSAALVIERPDMGVSHADFRRIFPRLVDDARVRWDGAAVEVSWPAGGRLVVRLGAEQVRRIALLSIPYTALRFEFHDLAPAAAAAFMARFDRAFHKGGG